MDFFSKINTGNTADGQIFAKSDTDISLSSTNHALTVGKEASNRNLALGVVSNIPSIQARNNGSNFPLCLNPLGGDIYVGNGSYTGPMSLLVNNLGSGTGDTSQLYCYNGTGAFFHGLTGSNYTTSGMYVQNSGLLIANTGITGGISIGTQANADIRFYTNNILRTTHYANGTVGFTGSISASNLSGTNTGDQTNILGNAATVTTNANLTGPITSVGNTTSVASQTGTGSKFVMDTNAVLIAPTLGNAKATTINTGTSGDGTIFAKSSNNLSVSSNNHALTVGDEPSGKNGAIGLYSGAFSIQARNNGVASGMYAQPLGGPFIIGDGAQTGNRTVLINNTGTGTGDFISLEQRNGATSANGFKTYTFGSNYTTSGLFAKNGTYLGVGSALVGGLTIGTEGSSDVRLFTNSILRATMAGATGTITTSGGVLSTGTDGVGYTTGAGGVVTQATNRSTAVTLNKICGTITMSSVAQASQAVSTFTFNNSTIAADDNIFLNHTANTPVSVAGAWNFSVKCNAGSATISIRNVTASSITEATPIQFTVIKSTNT